MRSTSRPARAWRTWARLSLAGLGGLAGLTGCVVPDLDLTSKKCQTDLDCVIPGQQCSAAGACEAPAQAADPCTTIPHFTGTQIVDGIDTELAAIAATTVDRLTGTTVGSFTPDAAGQGITLTARVAWSDQALSLFFHVDEDATGLVVPTASEPLYYGDGIEIFVKGDAMLTGTYDGTKDRGALQIILVPPSSAMGQPARAEMFVATGADDLGPLDASYYAFVVGASSYDLEVRLPWTLVQATPGLPAPAPGDHIGLDFGVDYHSRSASAEAYQLLFADVPPPDDLLCPNGPHPSCDDRTWCTPALSP
jgi:hypothetical protein